MKYKRQNKIIKIVKSSAIHTHDELIDALGREGFNVTQATVSRDIKEIGLVKVTASDGTSVYSIPEASSDNSASPDMLSHSIKRIVSAMHTVVINTYPGMASAVAAAVDGIMWNDILGSIAGDDTVLVIAESPEGAAAVQKRLCTEFKIVL